MTKRNKLLKDFVPKSIQNIASGQNQYSAFDIFNDIHKNDSLLINKDVCKIKTLFQHKINSKRNKDCYEQIKDVSGIKSFLLRNANSPYNFIRSKTKCSKRPTLTIRKTPNNGFTVIQSSKSSSRNSKTKIFLNTNITNCFEDKGKSIKINPNFRLWSKGKTPKTWNRYHRKKQQFIKRIDKIIHPAKTRMNKTLSVRDELLIEEYKQDRIKQRQEILDSIDTNNTNQIKVLYDYKLNFIKEYEKDMVENEENLDKRLAKSTMFIVKMGANNLKRKIMRNFINYKRGSNK